MSRKSKRCRHNQPSNKIQNHRCNQERTYKEQNGAYQEQSGASKDHPKWGLYGIKSLMEILLVRTSLDQKEQNCFGPFQYYQLKLNCVYVQNAPTIWVHGFSNKMLFTFPWLQQKSSQPRHSLQSYLDKIILMILNKARILQMQ